MLNMSPSVSVVRSTEFYEIMDMLDKRLNDKGKNWRHVLKALKVMDYCLHEGSELVVTWAKQNLFLIKTLREFQYIDEEGKDVGQNGGYFFSVLATVSKEGGRADLCCSSPCCRQGTDFAHPGRGETAGGAK